MGNILGFGFHMVSVTVTQFIQKQCVNEQACLGTKKNFTDIEIYFR